MAEICRNNLSKGKFEDMFPLSKVGYVRSEGEFPSKLNQISMRRNMGVLSLEVFGSISLAKLPAFVWGKSTTSWGHWKRCMMLSKTFKSYSYTFFLLGESIFWCLQYKHFISTYACFSLVWSFDLMKSYEICHSQLQDFRCNAANVPSAISGYDANGEIVTHHIRLQWRWSKRLQQRKCHLENHKIRDRKIADTNPLHQPKSFDQFFVGGDESRSEKSAFI